MKVIKETSKQCLKGLPKQVLNLINYGINKGMKKNCKDDDTKSLAGKNLACLNKVQEQMVSSMANVTEAFRLINFLPGDSKITALCCSFYKFTSEVTEIGLSKCSKSSTDHMHDLINDFSGEALDLVCRGIDKDSDTCKNFSFDDELRDKIDPTLEHVTFVPSCISALAQL